MSLSGHIDNESSRTQAGSTPAYFSLDPTSAAKQMAALNATSQLRRTSQSGGTSETIFGPRQSSANVAPSESLDSPAHQQRNFPNSAQVTRSRRDEFYRFLTNVMNARGTPLPPFVTGLPSPYDPTQSRWGPLEPSSEPGGFKLNGKDVDLFKLFHLVMTNGGHNKLNNNNGWSNLLSHLGMPEEATNEGVVRSLVHYSNALLFPLEEAYVKNMQQQRLVRQQQQQFSQSEMPPAGPSHSPFPPDPARQPSLSLEQTNHGMDLTSRSSSVPFEQLAQTTNDLPREESLNFPASADTDNELKRKLQREEEALKRVRQRTESFEETHGDNGVNAVHGPLTESHPVARPRQTSRPPMSSTNRIRRKIEYVPYGKEIETYGGRDLEFIEHEWNKLSLRRSQRRPEDWGIVDVDGLTLSLRSRLPIEMTYALTVLTNLSLMRSSPDQGFALSLCDDLLLELLELLRDQAFVDTEDISEVPEPITHRKLVDIVREQELAILSQSPHSDLKKLCLPGPKPCQRQIIFCILNLFRNLSLTTDNQRFLTQNTDVLSLLLRISCFSTTDRSSIQPASPTLALSDLVKVRKEVLAIVANLSPFIVLSAYLPSVQRRLFALLASFIMDPCELCSPASIVMQSGALSAASVRPPPTVDLALDAFSKLSQPDQNREEICFRISSSWQWSLFTSLVHRLPVSSEDFAISMRMHEVWISYIEKVVMSIYSLCFLATPQLKSRIKTDRTLGFVKIVFWMVKRFAIVPQPDMRQHFIISSRRAVEALRLVDDEKDVFESPQSTGPNLPFGMGFGESDSKQMESGTGLLAGFLDDVIWNLMLHSNVDDIMFAELESLCRISL